MNKNQKEEWIVNQFLEFYNKDSGNVILLPRRVPTTTAPGPDFIAEFKNGGNIGIEVTELFDYPSNKTSHQRVLQGKFIEFLNLKLDKAKFKEYSFGVYDTEYPTSELLENYADKVIQEINALDLKEVQNKGRKSFHVNQQKFTISAYQNRSNNQFVPFIFGENGVQEINRNNWFAALDLRIKDKQEKAQKYLNLQFNILVIYDNSNYGIFLNDVQQEIFQQLRETVSDNFQQVWLLEGGCIFEISNKFQRR